MVTKKGYKRYCLENSKLFYKIFEKIDPNCVFALSSGFFIYDNEEGLIEKHTKTVREQGISILLLPSGSMEESTGIVVKRQLERGLGYKKESETKKIILRYPEYKEIGDIKIFSSDTPENIAKDMKFRIESL